MLTVQLDLGTAFAPAEGSLTDAPLLSMDAIDRCSGHAVVFDMETTGLHWWTDKPIGMALYCPAQEIYGYIPFYTYQDRQQVQEVRTRMLRWSPQTTVFGHNLKFDFHMTGIDPSAVPWSYYDTMWMAHIVDSRGASLPGGGWINPLEEKGSLKLGDLARFYLGDESKLRWLDKQRGKKHWEWKLQALSRYAAEDARLTLALARVLWRELQRNGQLELVRKSMRWLAILWRTERAGILLDQDYLHQVKKFLQPQLEQLENELFTNPRINHRFDWRSHPVLSRVLYEEFGHPRPVNPFSEETRFKTQYTKTGTSSFLLAEKAHHPLANHIIQMRGIDKLLQFCTQWFGLVDADSYLHTSFNGTGARTGRISSSEPNLQQLPSDTRSSILTNVYEDIEALEAFFAQTNMRKAFRSKPGHSVLAVDYRQQEIRLFAVLSNDPNLLATIRSGQDVHGGIAQQIWGHNTDPWRDWAKVVSFGMLYGMTAGSLEFRLNKTRDEAFAIMDQYHAAFPRVKPWMAEVIKQMKEYGYATYWSGRRYYRDDPQYHYKAVNALIQGGAADLLMYAAIELQDWFDAEKIPARFLNFVHDEIDFEIEDDALEEYGPQIAKRLEMPHLLDIPFLTEAKVGQNLGSLQKRKDWA